MDLSQKRPGNQETSSIKHFFSRFFLLDRHVQYFIYFIFNIHWLWEYFLAQSQLSGWTCPCPWCASGAAGGAIPGRDSAGCGSQAEDRGDGVSHHLPGERGCDGGRDAHWAAGQAGALLRLLSKPGVMCGEFLCFMPFNAHGTIGASSLSYQASVSVGTWYWQIPTTPPLQGRRLSVQSLGLKSFSFSLCVRELPTGLRFECKLLCVVCVLLSMWPCDKLVTYPGRNPASAWRQPG